MKITPEELMDYVDETLSPERRARVEAHLSQNAEDAALLREMREARTMLQDWHEAEPVRVSDDFWIKVRDQLPPEGPRRSPLRRLGASLGAWLWPTHSPAALSLRVGMAAIVIAFGVFIFAPKHDTQQSIAKDTVPTQADFAFMKRASKQHKALTTAASANLASAPEAGDAGSQESGDASDDDDEATFTP